MTIATPLENDVNLNRLSDHDLLVRIATQVECLPDLEARIDSNTNSIRENSRELARLDERQKAYTGILGVIQALGFGVATWLGVKF